MAPQAAISKPFRVTGLGPLVPLFLSPWPIMRVTQLFLLLSPV